MVIEWYGCVCHWVDGMGVYVAGQVYCCKWRGFYNFKRTINN